MPAMFEQGFFVREPAWHGLGVVLDDYPGRDEAMRLAGHDWDVIELRSFTEYTNEVLAAAGQPINPDGRGRFKLDESVVSHVRSDTLGLLHKPRTSFERIPNAVAYDVAELLFDQGFQYETGVTLDGGALCAITLKLDEPITISGDDSVVLPFGCLSWAHDGTASLKVRSGTIRQVCANTVAASEAEGKRLGTDFTFRHTKNVQARIEDAKKAIRGVRHGLEVFAEAMEDLAQLEVTPEQRSLFVDTIIGAVKWNGDEHTSVERDTATTPRVRTNIMNDRAKVAQLFNGPTIPEAHKLTGYGLHLAGVEFFDHLRAFRTQESYVRRTLLSDNPAKVGLLKTIEKVTAVAA